MAEIEKKQKRWYAKSTFDSLDKTTIPVGTEIQVTGELGQADFDNDTNTKLNAVNGKLNVPNGEITEDSVPVISSTGTVSAKKLSELKIYLHRINMTTTWDGFSGTTDIHLELYNNNSTQYTLDTLIAKLKNKGTFNCLAGELSVSFNGIRFEDSGSNVDLILDETPFTTKTSRTATIGSSVTIDSFSDDVMEV